MAAQNDSFRDRFTTKQLLGKGAMAEVFLAFDNGLQRDVALKLCRLNQFEHHEDGIRNRRMWLNETRLAGKLKHPFIVEPTEAGSTTPKSSKTSLHKRRKRQSWHCSLRQTLPE